MTKKKKKLKTYKKGYFLGGMFNSMNSKGNYTLDMGKFSEGLGTGAQATGQPNYVQAEFIPEKEMKTERDLTAAAESIPVIGGFAKAGSRISSGIRGDETEGWRNAIGDQLGGFNTIKSIQSGNLEEAIPIYGGFAKAKRRKEEKEEFEEKQRKQDYYNKLTNSNISTTSRFGTGLAKGGTLKPISTDAVEVDAHTNGTDTVDIGRAFVDNDEIIDNKDRVFSDDLKLPSGKRSIAKEAKRLEKMKMDGYEEANELIDKKLDKLFNYQQMINGNSSGEYLQNGGPITKIAKKVKKGTNFILGDRDQIDKMRAYRSQPEQVAQQAQYLPDQPVDTGVDQNDPFSKYITDIPNIIKQYYDRYIKGESLGFDENKSAKKTPSYTEEDLQVKTLQDLLPKYKKGGAIGNYREGGNISNIPNPQRIGLDYGEDSLPNVNMEKVYVQDFQGTPITSNRDRFVDKAADLVGTYGSNIANELLIRNTPEVPELSKENKVSLDRISDRDIIEDINRRSRLQRLATNRNLSQSGTATAVNALGRAREIAEVNKVRGNTKRTNAEIAAREAGLNMPIRARNVQRENQKLLAEVERQNRINSLRSQNFADISNKIMNRRAENNMRDLDKARLATIRKQFEDSGLSKRFLDDYIKKMLMERGLTQ